MQDRAIVEEPIGTQLYFAGEALNPIYQSSVHAACESGLRASAVVLEAAPAKVGIIGAGMAGLTAASALTRAGGEVTVWEARDRIGGRLHTELNPKYMDEVFPDRGTGYEGGDILLPNGYSQIFEALEGEYTVALSHPVARVAIGADGVEMEREGGQVESFDAVLVTVPLGVLRRAASTSFRRSPPRNKLRSALA